MKRLKIMSLTCVILLICTRTSSSYPAKPLNERSSKLWPSWFFGTDHQQYTTAPKFVDNASHHRLISKSVFIAPTFALTPLPQCANGYEADGFGRCVKIITFDLQGHLAYLLKQLNQKFGSRKTYYYHQQQQPTSGPLKIKIPLWRGR